MYSPASQKLTVGSTVKLYVINAIKKENHPKIVFHFLKFKCAIKSMFVWLGEFNNKYETRHNYLVCLNIKQ